MFSEMVPVGNTHTHTVSHPLYKGGLTRLKNTCLFVRESEGILSMLSFSFFQGCILNVQQRERERKNVVASYLGLCVYKLLFSELEFSWKAAQPNPA